MARFPAAAAVPSESVPPASRSSAADRRRSRAGVVHLLQQLAKLLGLGLGGVHDGFGLFERAARHAGGLGGLVGGSPGYCCGQLARSNLPLAAPRRLSLFRRHLLQWLESALDGDRFGEREILP